MQWGAPEYCWLLLLVIPLLFAARRAQRTRHRNLQQLGYNGGRKEISPAVQIACQGTAFLLIIAALCRPQWGADTEVKESRGIDIVVALDTSRSMLATWRPPDWRRLNGLLLRLPDICRGTGSV